MDTTDATVKLCRKNDRWWICLEFDDGTSVMSKDDYGSQIEAQAALDRWCDQTGSIQSKAQ